MKNKKKIFGILVVVIILIIILCNSLKNKDTIKYEDIAWDKLALGSSLPEPIKTYGEVGVDLETSLSVTLLDYSKKDYIKYKDECIKENYIIERDESDESYIAFNNDGYQIRLVYTSEKFYIHLDAPEEMSEIEWPVVGLSTLIPIPSSSNGRISFNNDSNFIIHLSNISKEDLKSYKELCKEVGFNNIILEGDGIYKAKDENGNELHLLYLGFDNIEISVSSKKSSNNDKVEEEFDNTSKQPDDEKSKDNNVKEPVYYSTNDKNTVKNGNTGIFSYRSRGGQYYNYYIIDFDEGFVYFFSDGNGSETCDKIKITSGDLNSTLIITYHDKDSTWDEKLYFKYKSQPKHLIIESSGFEHDFYSTDLKKALKIRDKKEIKNY